MQVAVQSAKLEKGAELSLTQFQEGKTSEGGCQGHHQRTQSNGTPELHTGKAEDFLKDLQ